MQDGSLCVQFLKIKMRNLLSSQMNHYPAFSRAKFYWFCNQVRNSKGESSENLGPVLSSRLVRCWSLFQEQSCCGSLPYTKRQTKLNLEIQKWKRMVHPRKYERRTRAPIWAKGKVCNVVYLCGNFSFLHQGFGQLLRLWEVGVVYIWFFCWVLSLSLSLSLSLLFFGGFMGGVNFH